MIRAIIIDDELQSRKALQNLIGEYCPNVQIITTCDSVQAGYNAIQKYNPDLLFLDIEMNKESAFELLNKFENIDFEVIFTTAYETYALMAIKFCAIDYLLKPIDIEELHLAISKFEKKRNIFSFRKQFDVLIENSKISNRKNQQIVVSTIDGLSFFNVNDILRCEADGAYTHFYFKNMEKVTASKNIKEYEELLQGQNFFRVHNSFLINLKEIKRYVKGEGGYIIMSDNVKVDVSKRKKDAFLTKVASI